MSAAPSRGGPTRLAIERIVGAASRAPSAENCQPWTFRWDGEGLAIDHDADRARKGHDRTHHDSLLALGCLLEALEIAADGEGFTVHAQLSVAQPEARTWARVRLLPGHSGRAVLAEALARRCTDRRPFRGGSVDHPVFAEILAESGSAAGLRVGVPSDALLGFFREAEGFVWSHEPTWRDVMRWLRITRREVEETRDGASWQTLGVDLPQLRSLRLVRHPRARSILARTGAPRFLAGWLERQMRSAAGLVLVTVREPGREALVDAGRRMMRAWLLLTRADHGVQPHSQQSYFLHEAAVGSLADDVGPGWRERYARGLELVRSEFALDPGELPVMLLRTGHADSLPAHRRTLRKPVHEVLELG